MALNLITVTIPQVIGTGDGSTKMFPVYPGTDILKGFLNLAFQVNGVTVPSSGYTISNNNVVFASAPAASAVITDTGTFSTWTPDVYTQTSLTEVVPSYLYYQYNDDSDLNAFVAQFNSMAQEYVDWFNSINLPVYTSETIVDSLLDWVAEGLYGMTRPALPSGSAKSYGPINSFAFNEFPFNVYELIGPTNVYATTDDVFKRIMTWNFYKGDGYTFNVRWLKRRIERFLIGENGVDPNIDQTYQISVSFGLNNQVNINIVSGNRAVTGGSMFNRFAFNSIPFNTLLSTYTSLTPFELAPILQSAINAGVVQLPFQYTYVVSI